jgi:hypothetical protein
MTECNGLPSGNRCALGFVGYYATPGGYGFAIRNRAQFTVYATATVRGGQGTTGGLRAGCT